MSLKKLVLLDRDGVINQDSNLHIKSADEWQPLSGSLEAIARLNQAGYTVVVVTNQSGLARGLFDAFTLNKIHNKMNQEAAKFGAKIDAIFFCEHHPNNNCSCRKPQPGLIQAALARYKIKDSSQVPFVGDAISDIQAAIRSTVKPWLVLTGKGMDTLKHPSLDPKTKIVADLGEFANEFLRC